MVNYKIYVVKRVSEIYTVDVDVESENDAFDIDLDEYDLNYEGKEIEDVEIIEVEEI